MTGLFLEKPVNDQRLPRLPQRKKMTVPIAFVSEKPRCSNEAFDVAYRYYLFARSPYLSVITHQHHGIVDFANLMTEFEK